MDTSFSSSSQQEAEEAGRATYKDILKSDLSSEDDVIISRGGVHFIKQNNSQILCGIPSIYIANIYIYLELTDADVSPTRLSEVVSKIPTKATAMVLSDAINGKKNESITGDDVDITFVFQSDHFRSEDDEIFLTLNSTDTIRSVKYFLCRSLGAPDIMGNIVLRRTVEWTALQDHKTLSDYDIDEGATRLRVFRY